MSKSKDSIKCYSYTCFFVCNFSITNGSKSSKLISFFGRVNNCFHFIMLTDTYLVSAWSMSSTQLGKIKISSTNSLLGTEIYWVLQEYTPFLSHRGGPYGG